MGLSKEGVSSIVDTPPSFPQNRVCQIPGDFLMLRTVFKQRTSSVGGNLKFIIHLIKVEIKLDYYQMITSTSCKLKIESSFNPSSVNLQ